MTRTERMAMFALDVICALGGMVGVCTTVSLVGPVATAGYVMGTAVPLALAIVTIAFETKTLGRIRSRRGGVGRFVVEAVLATWTNVVAINGFVVLYLAFVAASWVCVSIAYAVRAQSRVRPDGSRV